MEIILLLIRIILAAIFALAGVGKLLDLQGSKKAVRDFGVPDVLARAFAILLPVAEIAIATLLLFTQTAWFGAAGAFLLLAIFIGGMAFQMAKGNAPDCHCFGAIHSEPISAKSLIRNAIFAILALVLIVAGRTNQGLNIFDSTNNFTEQNSMQMILGLATVGLLAAVVYFLKQISEQQTQIIRRIEILEFTAADGTKTVEREEAAAPENALPIGAPAPDLELPDSDGKMVSLEHLLMKAKPILLFFVSPICSPCGALLPEIETWQTELKDKLNFVFVSNGKASENARKFGGKNFKQILLQKDREVGALFGAKWTPTAILINADGTIASRAVAGDVAIRELIEKFKTESVGKDIFLIGNGDGGKNLGADLPEFALADASGKMINSEDLRGRKTLLTYWSLGCGYCTQMLEDLREWDKTKGQDEPNLLLLSSGEAEKNREMNLNSPVVLDDERKLAQKLEMNGTPSAILINENGKIVSEVAVGSQQIWTLIGKKPN